MEQTFPSFSFTTQLSNSCVHMPMESLCLSLTIRTVCEIAHNLSLDSQKKISFKEEQEKWRKNRESSLCFHISFSTLSIPFTLSSTTD